MSDLQGVELLSGKGGIAVGASGIYQIELGDLVTLSLDQEVVAVMTAGAFAVGRGAIADVDMMQSCVAADFVGSLKGVGRCGGILCPFISGMESAYVPGDLGAQVGGDELGNLVEFGVGIVDAGDDEGGDLEPDCGVISDVA